MWPHDQPIVLKTKLGPSPLRAWRTVGHSLSCYTIGREPVIELNSTVQNSSNHVTQLTDSHNWCAPLHSTRTEVKICACALAHLNTLAIALLPTIASEGLYKSRWKRARNKFSPFDNDRGQLIAVIGRTMLLEPLRDATYNHSIVFVEIYSLQRLLWRHVGHSGALGIQWCHRRRCLVSDPIFIPVRMHHDT